MTSALLSTHTIPDIATQCQYEPNILDSRQQPRKFKVQPPDKGWGWVVVFAAFLCSAIVDGLIFSFPSLFGILLDDLRVSYWIAILCAAFQIFAYLAVGPFVSKFLRHNTCRQFVCLGSLISTGGYILSAFISNELPPRLHFTISLTLGLGVGCGLGCIYISSICAVSCYFVRHRVAATTVALAGSGVGMTVFPPAIAHFTKSLDFNESMFYFAAISIQALFLGLLIWPLTELPPGCDIYAGHLPREKDIFDYIRERVGYGKSSGSRDSDLNVQACQIALHQAKQRRLIQLRLESECDPVARMDSERSCESPRQSSSGVNSISPIRDFLNRRLKRGHSKTNGETQSPSPVSSQSSTPVIRVQKSFATSLSTENAAIGSTQGISMRRQSTIPDRIFSQVSQVSQPPADITSFVGGVSVAENISVITDVGRRLDECSECSEFVLILDPNTKQDSNYAPRHKSVSECLQANGPSPVEAFVSVDSSTTTDVPPSHSSRSDEKLSNDENCNVNREQKDDQDVGNFFQDDIMALILKQQAALQEISMNGLDGISKAEEEKVQEGGENDELNVTRNDSEVGELPSSTTLGRRFYRRQSSSHSNRSALYRQRSIQKNEQKNSDTISQSNVSENAVSSETLTPPVLQKSQSDHSSLSSSQKLANGSCQEASFCDEEAKASSTPETVSKSWCCGFVNSRIFTQSPRFLIVCLGNAFAMAGIFVPLMFFPLRIIWLNGLQPSLFIELLDISPINASRLQAGFLISVAGSVGCVVRLGVVIGSELYRSDPLIPTTVAFLLQSLVVIASTVTSEFALLAVLIGVVAICTELFVSMTTAIIRWCFQPTSDGKKYDSDVINSAFCFLTIIRAFSAILGVLLTGYIFQWNDPQGSCLLVMPNSLLRPYAIALPSESDSCDSAFASTMYFTGATFFVAFLLHGTLLVIYSMKSYREKKSVCSKGTLLLRKMDDSN